MQMNIIDKEYLDQLEELKIIKKQMKSLYKTIKKDVESSVHFNKFATGKFISLVPFEQERIQIMRGKPIIKPTVIRNCYVFGFDDHKRICLIRRVGAEGAIEAEEFVKFKNDSFGICYKYLYGGKMAGALVRLDFQESGCLKSRLQLGAEGEILVERYLYEAGRIHTIEIKQQSNPKKNVIQYSYFLNYDGNGDGEAIYYDSDGKPNIAFTFRNIDSWVWPNE